MLAQGEVFEACYITRSVLLEMFKKERNSDLFPIPCFTDNKSLLESVYSRRNLKEKRLKVDACIIKQMLEKRKILLKN